MAAASAVSADTAGEPEAPARAGVVLAALIIGALACNINLAVANVALPDIGGALDATQTQLTLIAVGCALGLAMSVLYAGAIGDRYGRKMMLLAGLGLTVPISFLSAWSWDANLLVLARLLTGVAAGMAYPTTLALVTALWGDGPKRTRAIALWSAVSGGAAVIGPVIAGLLLEQLWWGSVFLIAVPVSVIGFVLVAVFVPAHANESTRAVDHLSGIASVVMIASLVLGISIISSPDRRVAALVALLVSVVLAALFVRRQRRITNPLYNLQYAGRRLFWVPALAGLIVNGALMGSMFIGQQFLQNILDYSTFHAGLAGLPLAIGMLLVAARSARFVVTRGSRFTLLLGYLIVLPATVVMLIVWKQGTAYPVIAATYFVIGLGAGFALTPASNSLTASVPVGEVGMASGTADLQRDLGGSIMQAIMGAALTLGYATSLSAAIGASQQAADITSETQSALLQSFTSAEQIAARYPDYRQQIIDAATDSFLEGSNWAFVAAVVAVALGAVLVWTRFPRHDAELALAADYRRHDESPDQSTLGA